MKEQYVNFLKWYSDSNYLEAEISGKFIDYKKPEIFYTADNIVEIFLSKVCPECNGEGEVERNIQRDGYPEVDAPVVCADCNGTGLLSKEQEADSKENEG